MTVAAVIAMLLLVVAGLMALTRMLRPGSISDRVVGLDTLLLVVVCGIGVHAAWTRSGILLDAMLVTAALGFLGTLAVARYIEQRGPR